MANPLANLGARLSYRVARLAAVIPGAAWHRYALVAVPVEVIPSGLRGLWTGIVAPEEAVACGLADAGAARWRSAQRMDCLGVRRASALVAVTWLGTDGFDEDEAWLRFETPAGAAWDTGMNVAPHARGGRAFAALWAATRDWARARGLGWSVSRIADYNLASRRAHTRLGGKEVGSVSIGVAAGWQWTIGARPTFARIGGPRPVVRPRLPA